MSDFDDDKTPPWGRRLSPASIALSDLAMSWAELRESVTRADMAADGPARDAALDEVELKLGLFGDQAHRLRVTIHLARERAKGVPTR